jgi:cytochrome P450
MPNDPMRRDDVGVLMVSSPASEPLTMPVGRSAIEPPAKLRELRAADPIAPLGYPDGHVGWLVTSYELGRAVLSDARFSMQPMRFPVGDPHRLADAFDQTRVELGFPDEVHEVFERTKAEGCPVVHAMTDPAVVRVLRESPPAGTGGLIGLDSPHHTRMRRALAVHFSPRRVAQHRELVETFVGRQLDEIEKSGPPTDLVETFAMPLTMSVICSLLGARPEDIPLFAPAIEARQDPESGAGEIVDTMRAFRRFDRELVERHRRDPGDDVISDLIRTTDLSDDELVNVAVQLFSAGFDTTANMLSLAIFALLQDCSRWEQLRADESLIPGAVEEILRYVTLIQIGTFSRTALDDVEVGGVTVRAGQSVTVSLSAANRDPKVFGDPDTLDLTRSASGHVSFGYGIHQCLGQHLARLELTTALAALIRRFPEMTLAVPEDQIAFHGGDRQTYGMQELPVRW